jgi:hypothetical protein
MSIRGPFYLPICLLIGPMAGGVVQLSQAEKAAENSRIFIDPIGYKPFDQLTL